MVRPSCRAHQWLDTGCRLPSRHGGKTVTVYCFFQCCGSDPHWLWSAGEQKWPTKIEKKKKISWFEVHNVFLLVLKASPVGINTMQFFILKNRFFLAVKLCKSLKPLIRIRNWIRFHIDLKYLIQNRNETYADPQHWFFCRKLSTVPGTCQ